MRAVGSLSGPGGEPILATASFDHTVRLWNPLTGETSPAEASMKNGMSTLNLTLPPRSGRFVVFSSR